MAKLPQEKPKEVIQAGLRTPLKRVRCDHGSRQVKMATNHPKNCRDRA
ncbi:hypothetical protein ACIPMB_005326 [Escherichia coli]|nr:hypothetical protein [Salmonella enterica subsp. enterica serovar Hadar]EJS6391792.1 hypothetical protein [Escherichia coli]ELV8817958.1 hypothetical protein [Salmonella enterica subsp. enterica serovar Hadar]